MSARGAKKRGRPPKVQVAERPAKKFQYQLLKKPKYLQNLNRGSDSPASTPSASRASSPQVEAPRRTRNARARGKKRGAAAAGGGAYQRRGYNPQASEYHESEYHYGSDFGDDSSEKSEPDDDGGASASDSEESVAAASSDSDFSLSSFSTVSGTQRRQRPPTPEPLWLQNKPIPPLALPKSSDDLLAPKTDIMAIVSIYEVVRHFRNLIRLSPFRLEDFCAALMCEDQSNLFAEIHIMLLKALFREEDSQQTHFAPLDQKDSVNIALYLLDYVTWPEVLRAYVESDPSFDEHVLNVLSTTDYPYTSLEDKIAVLRFLTDQFLTTNPVREDLISEVPMHYDDHCRVCHKLGDLLCCETCPAVFHLECVDPPLTDVPVEDWQCNICRSHRVSGVVDCVLDVEKQGQLCRQEQLGYDRFGRKYYFLCRRIFVENDNNEVWYYTTTLQFEELLNSLDADDMEADLCRELNDFRDEIIRQMELTEKLTNQFKGNKKTYLEQENSAIAKARKDADLKPADDEGKKSDEGENDSETTTETVVTTTTTTTTSIETKTEVTTTTTAMKNEDSNDASDVKEKDIVTRSKTGSLTPRTFNIDDVRKRTNSIVGKDAPATGNDERITRLKSMQLANGTFLYKLGMENQFKGYVNQFTTNVIALNKPQRNEERDKKRHLSHKFSLTTASEFKWGGVTTGNKAALLQTLRQTLIQLEQAIQAPFMHPNWPLLKKTWLSVVNQCGQARDFAKALIVLQSCVKPCVFANVWHDQLGHVKLTRVTAAEREERKKLEKREKKEREEEEERNRLIISGYVKYTMSFKHQLWKQKGEEYRIHGRWGWLWYSTARIVNFVNFNDVGLAAGPQTYMVRVRAKDGMKIIGVGRDLYVYLKKHFEIDENCVKQDAKLGEEAMDIEEEQTASNDDPVPDVLRNLKIVRPVKHFEEIDVSLALTTPGRILYPKVAKKSSLDDFLTRRIQLKTLEEREIARAKSGGQDAGTENEKTEDVDVETPTEAAPAASGTPVGKDVLNSIAKKIQQLRLHYTEISKLGKEYQCYSRGCNTNASMASINSSCYSPICIQRNKVRKELLFLLRKANVHTNPKLSATAQNGSSLKATSILEAKLTVPAAGATASDVKMYGAAKPVKSEAAEGETDLSGDLVSALMHATMCDDSAYAGMTPMDNPPEVKTEPFDSDEHNALIAAKRVVTPVVKEEEEAVKEEEEEEEKVEDAKKPKKRASKAISDDSQEVDMDMDMEMSPEDINEMILGSGVAATNATTANTPGRTTRSRSAVVTTTTTTTTVTSTSTTTKTVVDGVVKKESTTSKKAKDENVTKTVVSNGRTIQTMNAKSTIYTAALNRRFCAIRSTRREQTLKTETTDDGVQRIYTSSSSEGKVYLKRPTLPGGDKKKKKTTVKYPLSSTFKTRKSFTSLFVLPKHEARKLARNAGRIYINGFNAMAKSNNLVWPYPCARPLFKTCWIFRTINLKSIATAALQLKIMWACLRWDDMQAKPQNQDGKHQITTETEILSLELLKHRHIGAFMERTQYLRRKVVIPLELPKTVREVTSIRSGLRKRKRPESPQSTDPQVTEEWVDEDKLELWEIKQYGERLERQQQQVITRSRTGNLPPARTANETPDGPPPAKVLVTKQGAEDFKEKMEQQLRLQRAAHQQKRALELKNPQGQVIKLSTSQAATTTQVSTTKAIQPKVATDSKMQLVKNVVVPGQTGKTLTSLLTNNATGVKQFAGRRIFMTKAADGTTRVISGSPQIVKGPGGNQLVKLQSGQAAAGAATGTTPTTKLETTPQRVQIMRTPDGRFTVKGLMPGQQLVQMPDGKLQVLSTTPATTSAAVTAPTTPIKTTASAAPASVAANKIVKTPAGKVILQTVAANKLVNPLSTPTKQIIIKQAAAAPSTPPNQQKIVVSGSPVVQQQVVTSTAVAQQPQQQIITNQIVVNNQNLAAQIAQGKVQVATINGQQVLIRPTGNNQAQIVAQLTPSTVQQQQQVQPVVQQQPQQQQQVIASTPKPAEQPNVSKVDNSVDPVTMKHLLAGQPPGTIIKCVTAQVIQTPEGPRIVLQGLVGAEFTPQQMAAVQQQVKQQLLKAQASTGKQGVLGPTKIYLAVQPTGDSEVQSPPPLTPVVQQQQTVQVQPQQVVVQQQVVVNGQQQTSAILQAMKANLMEGSRVAKRATPQSEQQPEQLQQQTPQPQQQTTIVAPAAAAIAPAIAENQQFVVTPDYIQQTIRTALKQENLNPEIEEKLLQLQRYQERQMRNDDSPVMGGHNSIRGTAVSAPRKRQSSMSRFEDDDEEWVMDTPKRPRPSRTPLDSIKREQELQSISENVIKPMMPSRNKRPVIVKELTPEQKAASAKTKAMVSLFRHKEILKKDILRKRALLEKELQAEILKEVQDELAVTRVDHDRISKPDEPARTPSTGSSRRKANAVQQPTTPAVEKTPSKSSHRRSGGKVAVSPGKNKKEKLYCLCRTPYDETKFYVGCDLCNNWFHGDCVGITEEASKNLSEFICSECKHARETQELFCLCRQPYDESQFYICCDRCQDWFHGRCVGILQSEADNIDEYICPNCQRNSSVNYANMKDLSNKNFDELRRLIKQIQAHKSAWPFVEPVDPTEVPDYYKIIKEPMDLQKIENKINERTYNKLSEFIGDMTKIFDNCRYYNPKESQFFKCAESLEAYFVNKIKCLREKLYDN